MGWEVFLFLIGYLDFVDAERSLYKRGSLRQDVCAHFNPFDEAFS
jgi:hypothetical protein